MSNELVKVDSVSYTYEGQLREGAEGCLFLG